MKEFLEYSAKIFIGKNCHEKPIFGATYEKVISRFNFVVLRVSPNGKYRKSSNVESVSGYLTLYFYYNYYTSLSLNNFYLWRFI